MFLPTGVEDYLLYDFSLDEGDTFEMFNPITPFPKNGGIFTLDSIKSRILADNNPYRHFYFSPAPGNTVSTENAVWIEGIGSLSIINAPGGNPDINDAGHLSCFFKNANKVYENLDSIKACKADILSVYDVANPLVSLQWYTKNRMVHLENAQNVTQVSLYTITGSVLKKAVNIEGASKLSVSLEGFSTGLYLVVCKARNGSVKTFKVSIDH